MLNLSLLGASQGEISYNKITADTLPLFFSPTKLDKSAHKKLVDIVNLLVQYKADPNLKELVWSPYGVEENALTSCNHDPITNQPILNVEEKDGRLEIREPAEASATFRNVAVGLDKLSDLLYND